MQTSHKKLKRKSSKEVILYLRYYLFIHYQARPKVKAVRIFIANKLHNISSKYPDKIKVL